MKTQRIGRLISKKETNKQLKTFLCVLSSFDDRQMSLDDDDVQSKEQVLLRDARLYFEGRSVTTSKVLNEASVVD